MRNQKSLAFPIPFMYVLYYLCSNTLALSMCIKMAAVWVFKMIVQPESSAETTLYVLVTEAMFTWGDLVQLLEYTSTNII